jgi:hypothetical protein
MDVCAGPCDAGRLWTGEGGERILHGRYVWYKGDFSKGKAILFFFLNFATNSGITL